MNITINTQAKTVTIESACLKELSKVKKALEAIGEDPDVYTICSGVQYWQYPAQPYTWISVGDPNVGTGGIYSSNPTNHSLTTN